MSWQALGGKEAEIEARKQGILAGLKGIQTALSEAEKAIMERGEQGSRMRKAFWAVNRIKGLSDSPD